MKIEEAITTLKQFKTLLIANNSYKETQEAIDTVISLVNQLLKENEDLEVINKMLEFRNELEKENFMKAKIREKIKELKIEKDKEYIENGDSKDYYIYYGGILELDKILGEKDD